MALVPDSQPHKFLFCWDQLILQIQKTNKKSSENLGINKHLSDFKINYVYLYHAYVDLDDFKHADLAIVADQSGSALPYGMECW